VEETGVYHQPVAGHKQTLSHNVVSSTPRQERYVNTFNISMDSEVYLFLTIYYSFVDCHLYCAAVDGMQFFFDILIIIEIK
jgi:hypothetical protein